MLRTGVLTQHCVCVSRRSDRDNQRDNQREDGVREQDAEDSHSTQEWAIERRVGGGQELAKADIDRHEERERAEERERTEERERVFMQRMSGPANGRRQQVSVY